MNRKWKIALIATVVLLLAGTLVFAQAAGNSRRSEGQKTPFTLDGQVNCGPGRGSGFGGNGNNYGNGGGFGCH